MNLHKILDQVFEIAAQTGFRMHGEEALQDARGLCRGIGIVILTGREEQHQVHRKMMILLSGEGLVLW